MRGHAQRNESQSLKLLPLTDIQTDKDATPDLYAVGYNGTFVHKPNAGNWTKIATGESRNFNAIGFKDASKGVVVGDKACIHIVSVSGGTPSLASVPTNTSSTQHLNDVAVNALHIPQ
jgi:hypothetical protein